MLSFLPLRCSLSLGNCLVSESSKSSVGSFLKVSNPTTSAVLMMDPYSSSTDEEATDIHPPLTRKQRWRFYFGRILARLKVDHFPSFRLTFDFFPSKFAACLRPTSRNNHCKVPYPRTQQRDHGNGLNPGHVIRVVVKTTPLASQPRCRQ